MHILKIIHGYPPLYNAGSEVYSQSVCDELAKHHRVSVFTREENAYLPDFHIRRSGEVENPQCWFINMISSKDGFSNNVVDEKFRLLLNEIKPDIAHVGHLNHLSTGIIDILQQEGIPVIFTLHDFWLMCPRGQFLQRTSDESGLRTLCDKQDDRKCAVTCYAPNFTGRKDFAVEDLTYWTNWISKRMDETRSVVNKCSRFIAPSNYLRSRFVGQFGIEAEKISYLDYGFPLDYLTPVMEKETTGTFTFGYIGTHIPAKGVNLLIEAFEQVEGNAQLLIWGRQTDVNLIVMAARTSQRIKFMGEYINKNLTSEVFSKVDAIVVPSIWGENSPLVIHEAQACRVPVITADFGGMKEYVHHRVNGLLFVHRDKDSLRDRLQHAVNFPEEMKRLGERGYLYDRNGNVPGIEQHCEILTGIYQETIIRNAKTMAHYT